MPSRVGVEIRALHSPNFFSESYHDYYKVSVDLPAFELDWTYELLSPVIVYLRHVWNVATDLCHIYRYVSSILTLPFQLAFGIIDN